ncbi:ArnT family glycosyltransferase [Streptomyces sp. NPDC058382]|uniref:ArnT family glycosyltransferase n=1 Tax=unclassified Streptomyces TaxID=2593676 RepID=UPI00365A6B6A
MAAIATGTMPVLLGSAHVANTTSYEMPAWAAIALVVVRIGRTGDTRWWFAAGALVGIGAEFNHLAGVFGAVLLAAVLIGPARRTVAGLRLLRGAALAVLIVLPDLWWQSRHGWAMFEMTRALNGENGGPGNIPTWNMGRLGISCVAMVLLWMAGPRFPWRSGRPLWRCLVIAYAVLFVLFAVTTGAQAYYLAGLYVCLLAAGAVGLDAWLHSRSHPERMRRLVIATALSATLSAVIALPVLPASTTAWAYGVDPTSGETLGRPQVVGTVRQVWTGLPAGQRANAVIFAADYSEAGAVNELGQPWRRAAHRRRCPEHQLVVGPRQPTGHDRGGHPPGPDSAPGYAAHLRRYFRHVRVAADLSNPSGVHNIEWGGHVYVCTGPRRPWGEMWPELRNYACHGPGRRRANGQRIQQRLTHLRHRRRGGRCPDRRRPPAATLPRPAAGRADAPEPARAIAPHPGRAGSPTASGRCRRRPAPGGFVTAGTRERRDTDEPKAEHTLGRLSPSEP